MIQLKWAHLNLTENNNDRVKIIIKMRQLWFVFKWDESKHFTKEKKKETGHYLQRCYRGPLKHTNAHIQSLYVQRKLKVLLAKLWNRLGYSSRIKLKVNISLANWIILLPKQYSRKTVDGSSKILFLYLKFVQHTFWPQSDFFHLLISRPK